MARPAACRMSPLGGTLASAAHRGAPPTIEPMTPRFLHAGVSLLVFVLAATSCTGGPTLKGVVRTPPLSVGSISLPSGADGTTVSLLPPSGELYLVYFGYTSCPDVCPMTMSDISVALEGLTADQRGRVTVAMVTVDPERDTGERLATYLAHFFDRSLALRTDDPELLAATAATLGVLWEVAVHEPGEAYDVSHTAVTYVVDDTGTVVVEWPFGFDAEFMTSDLETLLARNS